MASTVFLYSIAFVSNMVVWLYDYIKNRRFYEFVEQGNLIRNIILMQALSTTNFEITLFYSLLESD